MSDTPDIEHFRSLLQQARSLVLSLRGAREISAATVMLDQSSVGRLSRMDALQQQAMAQNVQQRAERELGRIEAALPRCQNGSYSYCLHCYELIDLRRLELDPAASLCIRCARALDG